jgi:toxin ParE1/3/4
MRRVRVTRDAERDLDEIWYHVACDNLDAANHLVDELTSRFILIGFSPGIGRTRDELRPGLRSHPVGNYVITIAKRGRTFQSCTSCTEPGIQSACSRYRDLRPCRRARVRRVPATLVKDAQPPPLHFRRVTCRRHPAKPTGRDFCKIAQR